MRLASFALRASLAALLATAAAGAPPPPQAPLTWTVDAGADGALVEDHRAPLVTLIVRFPAGTWSPWVRRSHAIEAFEIQMRDPDGRLRRRADDLAAVIGLSVGDRSSWLQATFLKPDLDAVVALVRDILANRDFEKHELATRRRTAKISWQASLKEPEFRLQQEVVRQLFASGDPRRSPWEEPPPISTDISVLAEARDTLIRLPGRTVGFAGDLTPEEAERAAEGLLPAASARVPEDVAPRLAPLRVAGGGPDRVVELPRLTQVYFHLFRDSLPWTDPDAAAFLIADHVLGGHFYSRLYVALRHEGGETYGASAKSWGDVTQNAYILDTYTRTDNAGETESKLREVLRAFHENGITEQERADAAGNILGRKAFRRQAPAQALYRWLDEREMGLAAGALDALEDRAASLPLRDVNDFIRRWYDPARFAMVKAIAD